VRRCQRNGNDCIEFEVRDTGPGIAADQIESAFQPFSQLSSSSTRKNRGLGLGLALVQHHVDSLGASLEVNSDPGSGSSFVVRIFPKKGAGTAAA
jgi:signal transduction histidine kinase